MGDEMKLNGKLINVSVIKEGTSSSGKAWTLHQYLLLKDDGKNLKVSGFRELSKFDNKFVDMIVEKKINQVGDKTFTNYTLVDCNEQTGSDVVVETVSDETTPTRVDDYKEKEADKFTLGMSINGIMNLLHDGSPEEEEYKNQVRKFFKWNKDLRKEILGH